MKRIIFTFLLCALSGIAVLAVQISDNQGSYRTGSRAFPEGFTAAMKTCSPYKNDKKDELIGKQLVYTMKILGKRNNYCVVESSNSVITKSSTQRSGIICHISERDRKEFVDAMYGIGKNTDGIREYMGPPDGSFVWQRLREDRAICKPFRRNY